MGFAHNLFLGRVAGMVGVGLLLLTLGVANPLPAAAEEREYPTLVAFGFLTPLDSTEGLWSPVYFADHLSKGYYGRGTFTLMWETSSLTIGMRHPWGDSLAFEYKAKGEVITIGNGGDIYFEGTHQGSSTFEGHGFSTILVGHLFPNSPWRMRLEVEQMTTMFALGDETDPAFVLPPEFGLTETRLRLTRKGLLGSPKAELALQYDSGSRSGWTDWELDAVSAAHGQYTRTLVHWEQPVEWSTTNKTRLIVNNLTGSNLDLFSGFGIGGFAGKETVAGYFRNEFRARAATVANLRHQIFFAKDRIFSIFADTARFKELQLDYLAGSPESRTISGVGLGYRYGIRSMGGLPLIFRYGQGMGVPNGSLESQRREFGLIVAAGF